MASHLNYRNVYSQINVFGHIVSEKGIKLDHDKIEAIKNAPHPTTASEVRSFMGLTNCCSRYMPDYSSLTFPLRQLTKKNAKFPGITITRKHSSTQECHHHFASI